MRMMFLSLVCFVFSSSVFAQHDAAEENQTPQVSYIGFNTLKSDHKVENMQTFHAYIQTIKPLMAAHGMTLDVYRVDHASDPNNPVDFITFGTAKTQQSFQKFFANEDFQQAFPTLVGIIENHFVTFVDGPVIPEKIHGGHTRLSLDWLKSMDEGAIKKVAALEHKINGIAAQHGARQTHRVAGQAASTGLTDDIAPAEAPTIVTVWHMKDPHGFLERTEVRRLNKQAAEHSKTYRSYWISEVH